MTRQPPIRVLIADDHAVLLDALSLLITREEGLELAAAAADATQAIALAEREQPDVALLDLEMPGGGGVAAARGIAACSPRTRMMMLSAYGPASDPLEAGVVGHLCKGGSNDEIVDAVKRAAVLSRANPAP